jgi:type II secretory pathway pseudopilin PulG
LPALTAEKLAFTLTELLVAVGIMMVVIFALYKMFDETQRALRSNVTQVDVLESARAALELLTRDVEQATYADVPSDTLLRATNLYVLNYFNESPTYQPLNDRTQRTNFFQELFFLTRSNDYTWYANAYFVASLTNPAARVGPQGVGTLYRFSTPVRRDIDLPGWTTNRLDLDGLRDTRRLFHRVKTDLKFLTNNPAGYPVYPLLNGVTHLRWQAYDLAGRRLDYRLPALFPSVWMQADLKVPGATQFAFTNPPAAELHQPGVRSNALPAYLEMELAVLEAEAVERLKSMPTPERRHSFFTNQTGRVHLFRERIPIRTVPR